MVNEWLMNGFHRTRGEPRSQNPRGKKVASAMFLRLIRAVIPHGSFILENARGKATGKGTQAVTDVRWSSLLVLHSHRAPATALLPRPPRCLH
jgi:hypothetical protein